MAHKRPSMFLIIAMTIFAAWFGYIGHQLIALTALDLATKTLWWLKQHGSDVGVRQSRHRLLGPTGASGIRLRNHVA